MALNNQNRLRVSQAKRVDYVAWAEGLYLESRSSMTLEELLHKAAQDRLKLSRVFLREGRAALAASPSSPRSAVSRFYYAMYHAMRAACLVHHRGDDKQEHKALHKALPADLQDADDWSRWLVDARLARNRADYDPYPVSRDHWQKLAVEMADLAAKAVSEVGRYLAVKVSP